MPFATEYDVRSQTFLQDFQEVSSAQIQQCLENAHDDILAQSPLQDGDNVSPVIVKAEVLLAVSYIFRKKALATAARARSIHTHSIQTDEWKQVSRLNALAQELADEAWQLLRTELQIGSAPALLLGRCGTPLHP